jgi:hypothetical protein
LVFRNSNESGMIARQITPTPTVLQTPEKVENNSNIPVASNINSANAPEINKNSPSTAPENSSKKPLKEVLSKSVTATLALFTGAVRSEGKTPVLELAKETKSANFQLNLENADYPAYRAEIVDADGKLIYRSGKISARNSKIDTSFPTARLKKGDYLVKLYGFNSAGAEESAADFQFRVNQK